VNFYGSTGEAWYKNEQFELWTAEPRRLPRNVGIVQPEPDTATIWIKRTPGTRPESASLKSWRVIRKNVSCQVLVTTCYKQWPPPACAIDQLQRKKTRLHWNSVLVHRFSPAVIHTSCLLPRVQQCWLSAHFRSEILAREQGKGRSRYSVRF
jgi:hypothetical protein